MIFTPPTTPPAIVARAGDRAQGPAGVTLRRNVEDALDSRDLRGRGDAIFRTLAAALAEASAEGISTSPETLTRVIDILMMVPARLPLPDVVVESEHEVGLDWDEGARRVLSLTVRESPMIGYSAFLGSEPLYGRAPFFGELPETIRHLLGRLYPSTARRIALR